jgi:hypothetical protein
LGLESDKRIAKLPSETPHREKIAHFLKNYEAEGVKKECLLSLRHSSVRQTAIDIIHMSPDDADTANIMWNSISKMLTEEEKVKYRALMQFGRGLTTIRYIGGQNNGRGDCVLLGFFYSDSVGFSWRWLGIARNITGIISVDAVWHDLDC